MKKILIDLGSHKYEGLSKLIKDGIVDNSFFVYCYEANPNVFREAKNTFSFEYLESYNEAVSNFDGEATLNLDESQISQGCNIIADPPSEDVLWKTKYKWTPTNIKCVSIDTVLERCNLNEEDIVLVKCDIEGSEFEVLEMLLKNKNLNNIKQIFVEWHERFWHPNEKEKELKKQELTRLLIDNKIEVINWE